MFNPFSRANPDRALLIPVWSAADGVGAQAAVLAPIIVGTYVSSFGMSIYEAGLLLTLEFSSLAVTNFLIAPWVGRLNRRHMAITGVLFAALLNLLSAVVPPGSRLTAVRIACGVGYGLSMAAGNAAAAAAIDAARLYGHKIAMLALFASLMFLVIPLLTEHGGGHSIFIGMAGFNMLLLWPITRIPAFARVRDEVVIGRGSGLADLPVLVAALLVAAVLFFSIRDTMVAILLEQLGVGAGLNERQLGEVLSISGLVGIAGPLACIWMAHRFGSHGPMIAFVALGALVDHGAVFFKSTLLFSLMVVLQPVLNLGSYALHMSLAASIDGQGRLTTACGGTILATYAIAPLFAGYAMERGGSAQLHLALLGLSVLYFATFIALAVATRERQGHPFAAPR